MERRMDLTGRPEEEEVEVVARKMKIKHGGVQSEMGDCCTMRRAEVKKGATRSGRRHTAPAATRARRRRKSRPPRRRRCPV